MDSEPGCFQITLQHRSHYCILQWNTLHGHGTRYSLGPQLDPSNLWSAEDVVNAISLSYT